MSVPRRPLPDEVEVGAVRADIANMWDGDDCKGIRKCALEGEGEESTEEKTAFKGLLSNEVLLRWYEMEVSSVRRKYRYPPQKRYQRVFKP